MAATASTMLELGTQAPDFALAPAAGADAERVSRSDFDGRPLLVMFICNHCPYVRHVEVELGRLAAEASEHGVGVVAISSNDADAYPGDGPDGMAEQAARAGFAFPYLYDETQDVARAYFAACTPDFFLFDAQHRLAYRGRMDAATPGNGEPNDGAELRAAIEDVVAGRPPAADQLPSMGCSIKWRGA